MTEPTTQALIELADKYAFFMPGSAEGAKVREQLLDAIEAQARENERLTVGLTKAQDELHCTEATLEAASCDLSGPEFENGFDCMGDFAMAVWQGFKKDRDTLRAELAAIRAVPVSDVNAGLVELPKEDTEEANKAITSMLAEYQYPANPQNAGRAGWRAARLYTARTQQAPKGGE